MMLIKTTANLVNLLFLARYGKETRAAPTKLNTPPRENVKTAWLKKPIHIIKKSHTALKNLFS
jgi:hypothetical protein